MYKHGYPCLVYRNVIKHENTKIKMLNDVVLLHYYMEGSKTLLKLGID